MESLMPLLEALVKQKLAEIMKKYFSVFVSVKYL
jgi:hypothetical protein